MASLLIDEWSQRTSLDELTVRMYVLQASVMTNKYFIIRVFLLFFSVASFRCFSLVSSHSVSLYILFSRCDSLSPEIVQCISSSMPVCIDTSATYLWLILVVSCSPSVSGFCRSSSECLPFCTANILMCIVFYYNYYSRELWPVYYFLMKRVNQNKTRT